MSPEEQIRSNTDFYKKEAALAMSLADRIPKNKVEQDLRSKNRFKEHSREGCDLTDTGRKSSHQPNHTFHTCFCGWIGWLIPKDE